MYILLNGKYMQVTRTHVFKEVNFKNFKIRQKCTRIGAYLLLRVAFGVRLQKNFVKKCSYASPCSTMAENRVAPQGGTHILHLCQPKKPRCDMERYIFVISKVQSGNFRRIICPYRRSRRAEIIYRWSLKILPQLIFNGCFFGLTKNEYIS